jgi:hypothetical protein
VNLGNPSDKIGTPFEVICTCHFCRLGIYDEKIGAIRCPICFGHLRLSLNCERDDVGGFWGGTECEGVCGLTWTNLKEWKARPTPGTTLAAWR